jgi:predicted SnoaL-like aldol condensation-catalyzing enzyme
VKSTILTVLLAIGLLAAVPATAADPPGCACDSAQTRATEAVVRAYAQAVFVEHHVKEGLERYVAADIRQHNPNIADGRDAAIAFLAPRAGAWRSQIVNVIAQGPFAVVQQHAFSGPDDHLGRALVDIYKVKDGQIVEHWDVSQPVPEHSVNSMF